jgi:exodeoxyribonuclease VII large subunit
MNTEKILTVTSLNRYIKRLFQQDSNIQGVWIKGELSNFKRHSSGHMYFTLKDGSSRIQAVMFAGNNRYLKFTPESGMKVLIRGDIDVYEPNGQYQLYAKEMQPDGIGNLFLAYEQLKKKLELMGYFSPERKKDIPKYPTHIGVVTSPTGAAVRDIFTTIKRRYPNVHITVLPVIVQGTSAASSISKAIATANELNDFDVLIVGRGGGSIEELWAFNEEIVAKSIYESNIPVISAVGHETDFTISDFVADMRAPTPTAAAELAVPHIDELMERVNQRTLRLNRVIKDLVQTEREKLRNIQKSYAFKVPKQLLIQKAEQLDRRTEEIKRGTKNQLDRQKTKVERISRELYYHHPKNMLQSATDKYNQVVNDFQRNMDAVYKDKAYAFQHLITQMNAYNPMKVMDRGYSIVYDEDRKMIKSVEHVQQGDKLKVQLKDGQLDCQIQGIKEGE